MAATKGSSARRSRSTASERVRASRDGDRFHYTWGAARLLHLLSPASDLQQVVVEGAGSTSSEKEPDGSEVIDFTEFYGPPEESFTSLEVRQFKHSTLRSDENLTLGEVGKVFSKFAQLDDALHTRHPDATISFSIVTNKPIAREAITAVRDMATGQPPAEGSPAAKLKDAAKLTIAAAASLCSRLDLRGNEPGITALRRGLDREVGGLTADADLRVSASLVDLVASRASTESDGPILRADVLTAFGCREDELAPAPCLLDNAPFITREAYGDLADRILEAAGSMVVTAEGGVGKSTFARALPELLSDRADVIIYDCFGNGDYRNPARPRHRHRDGLVQLATEMAGLGLCFPIVQAGNLAPEEYTKAFVRRLDQASEMLMQSGDRQLVILVDAADNAVIAAEDNADSRSFVRDLLRLQSDIPPNVRIVLTCRPERLDRLEAPVGLVSFELPAFTPEETAKVVSSAHPSATNLDVTEIHDRTAGNPRVVSTVLFETATIHDALGRVTGFTNATSALDSLMQAQVTKAFNNAGRSRVELERAAQLLTLLRPSVPLGVLAELAGTQAASVRSFISDLGRGLILDGQSVQFLDEPTETYFRKRHPATQEVAAQAALQLRALSGSSAYAASSLPEVLWSANLHDELLALVATDDALPSTSDVERTQVEHLRVDFGLRAAVQLRRPDSIVQLAMRAGAGRAGKGRQFTIIRDNPDLAGSRMDSRVLGELIASRELPESWPGSTLGSEAALLAHTAGGASTARSRARQAASAIAAWVRAPRERYSRDENVTPEQVAHIALAVLRTDGPDSAAGYISGWRPARFVLESSAALARILISSASDEDVSGLIASSTHPALLLGVLGEMQRVGMTLDAHVVGDAWTKLKRFRSRLIAEDFDHRNAEDTAFRGASWLCALAVRHSIADATVAAERLRKCLPPSLPNGLGDRHGPGRSGLLFAVALRAELMGEALDVDHYRPTLVPAKRGKYDPAKSNDEDLNRYLRPALSWLSAWAKYARGGLDPQAAAGVIASYPKRHSQDEIWSMYNRIARQVLPLLGAATEEEAVTAACNQAIQGIAADAPIAGALDLILGLRGDTRFAQAVLDLSNAARHALSNTAEAADSKADTLVRIARGLHRFSRAEAESYFDLAVKAATGVGDDAIYRWDVIVALTQAAAGIDVIDAIALAERVAYLGEAVEPIVYDGFNEHKLVAALALISGTNVLRLLGQWRDRRFGTLNWQFRGLVEGDSALFAGRPDLTMILAPFSTNLGLSASLRELDESGGLNANTLSTVNNLANRLGCSLDAELTQTSLPDPPRTRDPDEFRSTTLDLTPDEAVERAAQLEECKARIAALDLTQASGVDAAIRLQQEAHSYGDSLFIAEVFTRPVLEWGPILDAALSSDALNDYELAKLLNAALARPRTAQSFVASLKKAVSTYVDRHGARLLHHNWMSFDLPAAAALLEMRTTDLLQRALDHLNLEEALTDADHCYMLAAGASAVLDPSTAARVLGEALATFERELDICPTAAAEQTPPDLIDVAVADFLWAALGDPRSAVRWQAAHAVRTAIELGIGAVIVALGSAAMRGDAAGYADERFLFYEMSAAEWFLVAVERVARDDPSAIDALLSVVIELSNRYPDHAAIQRHCSSIALLTTTPVDRRIGTDWKAALAETVALESWHRPTHPSPMMKGAPQAEHRFHSDFDEYVLGKLTKALVITHQEVLDAASALILDEWGWRTDGERLEDPRRTAATYQDGETYGYKWEIPKAEDLDYYLERHAALTIAGRLMRTAAPYRDPDAEQPDVLGWLADFDIARHDGRWITDQRSSVPGPLSTVGPRGSNQVHESEFLAALKPADGWVTVWQSASVTEYDRSLTIDIASALVNPEAAGALVRALQTADGYWSFRIPSADLDDEDFQFSSPPLQLQGWVSTPHSEGGIDRLDPLATELTPELPRPSANIAETLSITSGDGGLRWESKNGDVVLAAETWAEISLGREPHGPSGNRLRITTEALDQMLGHLGAALIVEVRVRLEDRRARYAGVTGNDDEGGGADHDNDFRVFFYQPGTGWNDFNGCVGTR
ncbi:MAG TPA: ATP-binding protein [Arachnia sp.]|nr:ATP-binding protein [Arachnia sp.]HMT86129.1 ATP-binding protein [Arachnia sp.]